MVAKKIKPVPDDIGESKLLAKSKKLVQKPVVWTSEYLEDLSVDNESCFFADSVYNSLVGDTPLTFNVKVPIHFKQALSAYSEQLKSLGHRSPDNNFYYLVNLILDSGIDKIYKMAVPSIVGQFVNVSLTRNLSQFPLKLQDSINNSLELPSWDSSSNLAHYLGSAIDDYKAYHEWLFNDAKADFTFRHYQDPNSRYGTPLSALDMATVNDELKREIQELKAYIFDLDTDYLDHDSSLSQKIQELKAYCSHDYENHLSGVDSDDDSDDDSDNHDDGDNQDSGDNSDSSKRFNQYPDESDDDYFKRVPYAQRPDESDNEYIDRVQKYQDDQNSLSVVLPPIKPRPYNPKPKPKLPKSLFSEPLFLYFSDVPGETLFLDIGREYTDDSEYSDEKPGKRHFFKRFKYRSFADNFSVQHRH